MKNPRNLRKKWGLSQTQKLRYQGLAGVYWHYLSLHVRKEDFTTYGGKCVSCDRKLEHWREGDCGHLIAAGKSGFALRFRRENLALQCKKCNSPRISPDAGVFFALETDKRWGQGTAEMLAKLRYAPAHEPTEQEYVNLLAALGVVPIV